MSLKSVMAVALTAVVLLGVTRSVRADEKELRDKIMAIDKELMPMKQKAANDPDVKAAQEALKAAQTKVTQATEAAMIKADPKAKDLLEQRAKLQTEAMAEHRAALGAARKAPAEKKE